MDAPATYSGKSTIISSKYSRGIEVTLPSPGFPDSNYSVNVTPIAFENSSPFISIYDGIRFWIGGNPGDYLWTATNQNGSNGGGTGSGSAGPTGSIQLSDGAGGFTSSTGFYYQSDINFYALHGGPAGNIIGFEDGGGNMLVGVGNTGGTLVLEGGVSGGVQLNGGSLQVRIGGTNGSSSQYLGSDGAGNVTWSTPPTSSGATGTDATLSLGTYTSVPYGNPLVITNTGLTPSNAIFNFQIPQGQQGIQGNARVVQ